MRTAWILLLSLVLFAPGCEVVPADDDDDGDDDTSADDDTGDDDSEWPCDDPGDAFYTDPGDLPEGANPCMEPVLVSLLEAVDGDTAWVDMPSGPHEKVRFIGVDTPEMGYQGDPDECYAVEAKEYTQSKLAASCIWLTFDSECRDPYDRLLAYVHTRNGFFEVALLDGGYAWTLAIEPNTTYASMFSDAQSDAQGMGAGLWGACD